MKPPSFAGDVNERNPETMRSSAGLGKPVRVRGILLIITGDSPSMPAISRTWVTTTLGWLAFVNGTFRFHAALVTGRLVPLFLFLPATETGPKSLAGFLLLLFLNGNGLRTERGSSRAEG